MAQWQCRDFTGKGPHQLVPSSTGYRQGEQERPMDDTHAQPRGQIIRQVGGDEACPRPSHEVNLQLRAKGSMASHGHGYG